MKNKESFSQFPLEAMHIFHLSSRKNSRVHESDQLSSQVLYIRSLGLKDATTIYMKFHDMKQGLSSEFQQLNATLGLNDKFQNDNILC